MSKAFLRKTFAAMLSRETIRHRDKRAQKLNYKQEENQDDGREENEGEKLTIG